MIQEILKEGRFIALMQKHCMEIIELLMEKKIEFSIFVNPKFVDFKPALPQELDPRREPYVLFTLAGYTFKSLELGEKCITFHAGFGPDDFATFVEVDLGAITHIQVQDGVIFVNFSFYKSKENELENLKHSMNAFLNNPKNKDLFKK